MDISLDSTGITYFNGEETGYFSFFNIRKLTTAKKVDMEKTLDINPMVKALLNVPNLKVNFYDRIPSSPSGSTLNKWHRNHLGFCTSVPQQIVNTLLSLKMQTGKKLVINIEFYSYGSAGSSSYQIAEFTGILKMLLFKEDVCLPDDIYVTPGPGIKMFAGKGNYQKYDMLTAYNDSNVKIVNDEFVSFVRNNMNIICKDKVTGKGSIIEKIVIAPISDIIDSWWIAKYLQNELSLNK